MKIIPLADRVVIKTVEVEETTKGGLILTGSAKEKPQVAQVVAVGPGGVVDGKEVKMYCQGGRQGAHQQVLRHRGQGGRRGMHHRASEPTFWPSWNKRLSLTLDNQAFTKERYNYG